MSHSDMIVLGIGPGADIPHLVLTGLFSLSSPSQIPSVGSITPGTVVTLFDAVDSEGGLSSNAGVLPGEACEISWQVSYADVIATAEIFLELSLDGIHYNIADTSTNIAGEIRQVYTAARFVRVSFGTTDEGVTTTVKLVVQIVPRTQL